METAFASIWTDCKLFVGALGIIGIVIGSALLASAEADDDAVGAVGAPKNENAGLKYTGLVILLISICAVGVNMYYLYQKKCRKVIYDWNAGNI